MLAQFQETLFLLDAGLVLCAALAAAFFVLAVVFFFKYQVPTILRQRSSYAARYQISKLSHEKAQSGALRDERLARGELTQRPSKSQGLQGSHGGLSPLIQASRAKRGAAIVTPEPSGPARTTLLKHELPPTTLLDGEESA